MKRRDFIKVVAGSTAVWPRVVHAQQPAMPVIGFLSGVSPSGAYAGALAGFHRGLAENGFTEGVNVAVEYRWAEGHYERLAGMADDLVRRNVSVIFANASNLGIQAAKAATTTIPIVFTTATDPVESGLVTSLNRPAGNITGLNLMFYIVEAKRLELFHELVPKATAIRVIANRSNPVAAISERNVRQAADAGLDTGAIAAGDPYRSDRVPCPGRPGRRRLRQEFGASRRQRQRAWMNRCIIIGAINHSSGGENRKLATTTDGIQKNAC